MSDVVHKCNKEDDIAEIKKDVKTVMKLINGNGTLGFGEMARRSFEWMTVQKSTRNGMLDWLFRSLITIMLGFIAMKVGLK